VAPVIGWSNGMSMAVRASCRFGKLRRARLSFSQGPRADTGGKVAR
jgi:hypothetical protein